MPTEAFTTSPFPAQGRLGPSTGGVNRTPRERLLETINIRDFGAVGNGTTDDGPALIAAINFLKSITSAGHIFGRSLYFPKGQYWIDPSHLPLQLDFYPDNGSACLFGDGKDASWIISDYGVNGNGWYYPGGNYTAGTSVPMFYVRGGVSSQIQNLTFWNKSAIYDATTLACNGNENNACIQNCRFIASRGLVWESGQFDSSILNCEFRSGYPNLRVNAADSSARGPIPRSVGLFWSQGNVSACRFLGYDIGLGLSQVTIYDTAAAIPTGTAQSQIVSTCLFSQCNIGLTGQTSIATFNVTGQTAVAGITVQSNWFESCRLPLYLNQGEGWTLVANTITGIKGGPANPASMNISWNGSTVTCTTPSAHNISGDQKLIAIGFPTSAQDNMVDAHVISTTSFSFPSTVNPGVASGQWNYPADRGIYAAKISRVLIAANTLQQPTSGVGIDWSTQDNGLDGAVSVWATECRYGWSHPIHVNSPDLYYSATALQFLQCYTPGQPPPDTWNTAVDLATPDITRTQTVIDCPSLPAFGSVLGVYATVAVDAPVGQATLIFTSLPTEVVAGMRAMSIGGDGIFPNFLVQSVSGNNVTFDAGVGRSTTFAGTLVYFYFFGGTNHYKIGMVNGKQARLG